MNGDIIDFTSAGNPTNVMTLGPRLSTNLSSSIDLTVYNGVDLTTVFSCKVAMPYDANGSGKSRHITISCDVSDTNKRHAVVDGVVANATWSNYNNINVGWSKHTRCIIGDDFNGGGRRNQQLGEYYLNNSYTDLSTDNPFWDSDANRPKPVAQVIEETGTTPLIALPLRADDAGNNLGTAGDFTVNSGPFTGARGGSEFWARGAVASSTSSTNRLQRTSALTGASNGKQFTFVCAYKPDSIGSGGSKYLLKITDGVTIDMYNYDQWSVSGYDASGARDLFCYANNNSNVRAGEWTYILV
ncbi:MAG: hypothetical protein GY918_08425, partial [Gammaproteobacteria bacterium]|nr:hypothetical protein [Gammaproteobacteria bacterium]